MPDTISNILPEVVCEGFLEKFLNAESGLARVTTLSNSSVIAIMIVLAFLLLGIAIRNVKHTYIQYLKDLFGSTKYSQKFNYTKEDTVSQIIIWILVLFGFSLFFVLSFDFFNNLNTVFQYHEKFDVLFNFFKKTTITFFVIGIILWLQQKFLTFVSWLFSFDKSVVELILHFYFLIVKLLGITLLIVSFVFLYSPVLWQIYTLYLGLIIVFGAFLLLIIYYIGNFFSKIASLFYFFLYLCTLEILPILVLRKLLIGAYKMF